MPSSADFKRGVRFLYEGAPLQIVDVAFQTPSARGAATLVKVKARDLLTGQLRSLSLRSGERFEDPDIEMRKVQFLYGDGEVWHFMDVDTYDQYELQGDSVSGSKDYLVEGLLVRMMLYNGNPISLELPSALEMEIAECEQAIKGDTVTNVTKTARLATGLEIQVPLFINQGDIVRVDTSEGRYVERVKVGK
jgi:elongation factor P